MLLTADHLIWSLVTVFVPFIVIYLYSKRHLLNGLPKHQICWFCHKSQEVPKSKINAFDCIHCHQYNGFSEDGNYNRVIGAQHSSLAVGQYCRPIADCYSKSVQLCAECNVRQEIKVKLLAQFVPFNEINFSQECDEYKRHLECEYKLCSECQIRVNEVLSMPINCIKVDSTANTSHPTHPKTYIDSVFINRESERALNWLSFVTITAFETLSLLIASILLISGLRSLQDNSELSFIEFPQNLIQLLDYYLLGETALLYSGFVCSVTALVINGKHSVQTTDLFTQLLWLALICCETPLIKGYIDRIDGLLLRPILSSFVIIFSTINTSLRSFALFKAKFKNKSNESKTEEQKKSFEKSTENNKLAVLWNRRQEKSFSDNNIKLNKTRNQSIGEQIKSLSIADQSVPTFSHRISKHFKVENNSFAKTLLNSSSTLDTSLTKSLILPARFNPEPIPQTSWVSALKPNTSPLKNNRKENLNCLPYLSSSHSLIRTSQWVGNQVSGLMTPPPSATTSVCSDSAFGVNRLSSLNVNNCLSNHMFDNQRNSNDISNNTLMRSQLISHHVYSHRESSVETNSRESDVTQVTGSLSSLTIQRRSHNHNPDHIHYKPSLSQKLTQNIVLALFLLLLFCFVIFLSLPVVFKTSCDLNSLHFHFTVESLPQNDRCIK